MLERIESDSNLGLRVTGGLTFGPKPETGGLTFGPKPAIDKG